MKHVMAAALLWLVAACGSQPAAAPSSTTLLAAPSPSTAELDAAADEICRGNSWTGIRDGASFAEEAAVLAVSSDVVLSAVRRACPDALFTPLSQAEVDWCGDGRSFGQNYFKVIAAGVDQGIESFAIVEADLIAKAANGIELTDYEIELLTAELQTMSESSRFERDWAEACRTTY
jgi:hypothetical protein